MKLRLQPRALSRRRRLARYFAAAAAVGFLFFPKSSSAQTGTSPPQTATAPKRFRTCAKCHAAIAASYAQTAMANASGSAIDGLITGQMEQRGAGVVYRVHDADGQVWLGFASVKDPEVRGKRLLKYYIGSGKRGRTYLFSIDNFWFESPVNWYGQKKAWDMTPAYQNAKEAPLNLPLAASCLACHTTGMSAPQAGTENHYATPLFQHMGVGCSRCHGDSEAHLQGGSILNPLKLSPSRRDSICMQCHLEGNAAIEQPGKHLYQFKPGDELSDYVTYFVKTAETEGSHRAASQFEALAQSACKKKTGDSMSCMSCHDPHLTPAPEERVTYYREKCLACHGEKFASHHHAKEQDCVGCHMPPVASSDVAHTQATDHRILANPDAGPGPWSLPVAPLNGLAVFPAPAKTPPPLRDVALAWVAMEKKGIPGASHQVNDLLPKALKQSPDDPALLTAYAYDLQTRGQTVQAREFYEHALKINPDDADAQTNLAVIEANSGDASAAIAHWMRAFQNKPWQDSIGMNLALTLCRGERYNEARDVILRVLQFDPDSPDAKQLLRRLNSDRPNACR